MQLYLQRKQKVGIYNDKVSMNLFLDFETCLIVAIDTVLCSTLKKPNNEEEFKTWMQHNSKKIGTEAKRLATRYILDITSDNVWYENFYSNEPKYSVESIQNWKKYVL